MKNLLLLLFTITLLSGCEKFNCYDTTTGYLTQIYKKAPSGDYTVFHKRVEEEAMCNMSRTEIQNIAKKRNGTITYGTDSTVTVAFWFSKK